MLTPLWSFPIWHTHVLIAWIHLQFQQLEVSSGLEDSRATLWASGCLWHSSPEIRTLILVKKPRLLSDDAAQSISAS